MSTNVGSVGFRFNRLTGRDEPRIGTSTVVAGVRGTEVIVYAGANGSSLFLVETGEVTVTSGRSHGQPGRKRRCRSPRGRASRREVRVCLAGRSTSAGWNAEKVEEYLADPVAGAEALIVQLDEFIQGTQEYRDLFDELSVERDAVYEAVAEMEEGDEREALRRELLSLNARNRTLVLNYRYYALSGLSLRRYILGKMYVELTTRYIMDKDNPTYTDFVAVYNEFLDRYDSGIVPNLVEADI